MKEKKITASFYLKKKEKAKKSIGHKGPRNAGIVSATTKKSKEP